MPDEGTDFGLLDDDKIFSIVSRSWFNDQLTRYSIGVLRAEVEVDSYLSAQHLPRGGPHSDEDVDEARRVFAIGSKIASELTRRYIEHVRDIDKDDGGTTCVLTRRPTAAAHRRVGP